MNYSLFVLAFALLIFGYSVLVIVDCVTRQPLSELHRQHYERRQFFWTIVLVGAAFVLGLTLENLI
jgi:cell division protein FtsW (lipid II flippase)